MSTYLIGTAQDQIPTNGDLGDLAFQSKESVKFTGGEGSLHELMLNPIYKEITATAVDVFVYDTSKDSDGGAWRKRCQHTSWYNETLNYGTRGSRKEFPAVAVIIADASNIYIHDGDSPNLPLWMKIRRYSGAHSWNVCGLIPDYANITAISALNGIVAFSQSGDYKSVGWINFISDTADAIPSAYWGWCRYAGSIAQRDEGIGFDISINTSLTVGAGNDIAMTVLPNAPIDKTTGLPIPTIAVATSGGVSVIKHNGSVYNLTGNNWSLTSTSLAFDKNGILYFSQNNYYWLSCDVNGLTQSYSNLNDGRDYYQAAVDTYPFKQVSCYNNNGWSAYLDPAVSTNGDFNFAHYSSYTPPYDRVVRHDIGPWADGYQGNKQMMNYTSRKYNTGWMHGNIKGAWLSDTTQETYVPTSLVTNSSCDTTTGYSAYGSTATMSAGGGVITYTATIAGLYGGGYTLSGLTVGQQYAFRADVSTSNASASLRIQISGVGLRNSSGVLSGSGSKTLYDSFVATATSHFIEFLDYGGSAVGNTFTIDNVYFFKADNDRSLATNGLYQNGTVVKTPVAAGADLVSYKGATAFGPAYTYFYAPYIPAIGTGDFSVSMWVKPNSDVGAYFHAFSVGAGQGGSGGSGFTFKFWIADGKATPYFYASGDLGSYSADNWLHLGMWGHVVMGRENGILKIYLNGVLKRTSANTTNFTPTRAYIGRDETTAEVQSSEITLVRYSTTFPSSDQVAKMYNDERILFQENAKATLYGTSDVVTALAYDDSTNLLHVGTSSGRSVFHGLKRVDNTTTAVGACISASNGMVVED